MSEVTSSGTRRGFSGRLIGALMLDASVYEEVEHDPDALGQAALVVALGAVASGIAGAGGGGSGVIGGVLLAGVGWVIGAGVVWLIGVRMMDHTSDFLELLRTLGFASAPRVLMILAIIPFVGWLVGLVVLVLSLIAWVLAVRQALDVETGRAVLVCVLAFVAQIVFGFVLAIVGLGAVATAV
jgi:hypothetical protein